MAFTQKNTWSNTDYALAAAVMCLMGGYYWAIRGTGGYGGETGGALAGLGWALLWYAFSRWGGEGGRRPYASAWMVVAISMGIALGGMTGYGVYISWVRGLFHLNYPESPRAVGAWTGYAMLFICGLHWGGNTGAFMAWCAPQKPLGPGGKWMRFASGVAGAVAAAVFVRAFPQLFLPYYGEGIYAVEANETCVRALGSLHTIAPHVGLFLGFLAFELARGDRRAAAMMITMALGFALPFTIGAYWHTFQDSPLRIGWWKNWEMSIGLGGGLAFGLAFFLFNQPDGTPAPALGPKSRIFFLTGLPLVFPMIQVFLGAFDGWHQLRDTKPAAAGYALFVLLPGLVMPIAALGAVRRNEASAAPEDFPGLSMPLIAALQAIIILCGILVSIPLKMEPENTVLLTCYAVYLAGSLGAVTMLWKRQEG